MDLFECIGKHHIIQKIGIKSLCMNAEFLKSIDLIKFYFLQVHRKTSHLYGVATDIGDLHPTDPAMIFCVCIGVQFRASVGEWYGRMFFKCYATTNNVFTRCSC